MAVKVLIIVCFLMLLYFLAAELLAARKWKRLVKYAGKYGFSDEKYEEIVKRDTEIAKKNKLFQFDWLHPTKDMRRARKIGFIRVPARIQFGLVDEYWEQALWCLYYCDGSLEKGRETWPWRGMDEKSTWDEKYVRNKFRKNGDNR